MRVLLGCALGLILAEVGLRIYFDLIPSQGGNYTADPVAGYRLASSVDADTSGFGYVNRLGFRDREPARPKPPGVRRVIGIGDSFVLGEVALRDNFLRVAERETGGDDSLRTEVLLMGLGGYSPENYVGVLRAAALQCDPDLVLLCFYVGNDVIGLATRSRVRHGELYPESSANPGLDLLRKSRLFAFLEKSWATRQHRVSRRRSSLSPSDAPGTLSRFYLAVLRNRLPTYAREPDARMRRLWTQAETHLAAFDRLCAEAGVAWALVLIPDEIQVDPSVRADGLRRLGRNPGEFDFDGPQRRLGAWADERSVPALDLLPLLRSHTAEGPFYISGNTHWNEKGNRVAGLAVAEFLRGVTAGRIDR